MSIIPLLNGIKPDEVTRRINLMYFIVGQSNRKGRGMSFCWSNRILRIDLVAGKSWVEETESYTPLFLGGKGINIKIMFDEVDPKVGPFDPENLICYGPGVLTGTLAPTHSRMKITSISPNGLLQNSGIGGYVPAEIRRAGYDNIIIRGRSDKPAYLYINNDEVEIRDATLLWGKDTQETQRAIKQEIGDAFKIVCIGPAGENLVSFGCIVTGAGSAAGRGGFGAVMGSKNLKAIAIRGTGQVTIAKPSQFLQACIETRHWLPESALSVKMQSKEGHGDKFQMEVSHKIGFHAIGNWEEEEVTSDESGQFEGAEEFYKKFATRQYGCDGCPVHHYHMFDIPGRSHGATKCVQWSSFADPVWVNDRKVIVHANILCNKYGLDSTGAGNAVSFLMELYQKGIISEKDTDGIPMRRGDERAIFAAIEKIGRQEGFGRLFKNGVWGAAKEIGNAAEECAVTVNKQEVEDYEIRAYKVGALIAALTDGTFAHSWPSSNTRWVMAKEEMEKMAEELVGHREAAVPHTYEKKALIVWDAENRSTAGDMLGTCRWFIPWKVSKLDIPAKLFSLATGCETSEDDLLLAAQRTLTLERALRVMRGVRRDKLPEKIFKYPVPSGIYKGERLDRKRFEKMLDEYYDLRGWDNNGIPLEETFERFGLPSEWKKLRDYLKRQ
jgi:aldehyde:ferredoxin oxidoreductase